MIIQKPLREQERPPGLPPVTFGVFASWLLALGFGVAFWTLLIHVAAPLIMRAF
jgi:hypothetical protein